MKIKEIYELAIKMGIEKDPRGKKEIEKILKREKEKFENLSDDEKMEYDRERLKNPFADTRILYGDPEKKVKRVLAGIDIGVGEVLLAERLREKGKEIDLLITHHPEGRALVSLYLVMGMQADIWAKFGVPINVAEGILEERIREVRRNLLPVNYNQAVDACKILDIPLMCVHTPADNLVTDYLQKIFDKEKPEIVKDVLKILKKEFEYAESLKHNAGPLLIEGKEERRCGKVMVDMTGGTGGPKEMMEKLSQAGVGTLVCMHIRDEVRKEAKKYHINIIIAGHMASDSLGINIFLNELEKKGIEIISCAGLIRKGGR